MSESKLKNLKNAGLKTETEIGNPFNFLSAHGCKGSLQSGFCAAKIMQTHKKTHFSLW